MFYTFPVTVPKKTAQLSPQITEIVLGPGEIHQVEIGFPWGCAGLVHVQIWRAEHQVWPTNAGQSFAWNDYNHVFTESETCQGPGEHWTIRAWNLDKRWSHTVQVRIGILETKKLTLGRVAEALFGRAGG